VADDTGLKPGDLVLNMLEHRPRVGRWVPPSHVQYSVMDSTTDENYYLLTRVEAEHLLPYAGPNLPLGTRIDRENALAGRPDNFHGRLPNSLSLLQIVIECRDDLSEATDDAFLVCQAFLLLEQRHEAQCERVPNKPAYMLPEGESRYIQSPGDKYFDLRQAPTEIQLAPFTSYKKWSADDLAVLIAANTRRKAARAAWDVTENEIATVLQSLGVSALRGPASSKYGSDFSLLLACQENELSGILEFLETLPARLSWVMPLLEAGDTIYADYCVEPASAQSYGPAWPSSDETAASIAQRVAFDPARVSRVINAWTESRGDLSLFSSLVRRYLPRERVDFAIKAFAAKGEVSFIIGESGIGKSTLTLQAGLCVANGVDFLGLPTEKGKVVFLSGEDSLPAVDERLCLMASALGLEEDDVILIDPKEKSIEHVLLTISNIAGISLIIVDTFSIICDRIIDAESVRKIIKLLRNFAVAKSCAVLVLHHPNKSNKSSGFKSYAAVMAAIKGSGEIRNAPRIILTMHQQSDYRVIFRGKWNMPNTTLRLAEPLCLSYDATTELHTPIEPPILAAADGGAEPSPRQAKEKSVPSEGPSQLVLNVAAVVNEAIAQGRGIAITGDKEPYAIKHPLLAGVPRTQVRAAHREAIKLGLIQPAAKKKSAAVSRLSADRPDISP
jgi:archaellum biogenesis ATPase FlaH